MKLMLVLHFCTGTKQNQCSRLKILSYISIGMEFCIDSCAFGLISTSFSPVCFLLPEERVLSFYDSQFGFSESLWIGNSVHTCSCEYRPFILSRLTPRGVFSALGYNELKRPVLYNESFQESKCCWFAKVMTLYLKMML